MKQLILVSAAAVGVAAALIAQQKSPETGAKALFLDPTSGAAVAPMNTGASGRSGSGATKKRPEAAMTVNAGLMYYIERQRPDGQLERVNPTATFRSGDKIRIYLKSNVNGKLVIAQRDSDGGSGVLFPDSRVDGGDNRIRAGQVTALPSGSTWFKFDEHPGKEHLLVLLTPEGNQPAAGAFPDVPPKQWNPQRTEQVALLAQAQKGSKALVVEVDETKESAATYVVQPAGQTVAQGVITTEIVLQHQ